MTFRLIFIAVCLFSVFWTGVGYGDTDIVLGVLAKRGDARCLERWQATAEYLNQTVTDHHFAIRPLPFDAVIPAVNNEDIDLVLANPALYVQLEREHGVKRIATMKNSINGRSETLFGGVVFVRSDSSIHSLKDLAGRELAAVDKSSFGGWLMALAELRRSLPRGEQSLRKVDFLKTHDGVVEAVLEGDADVGTVRTDTLKRMSSEGVLDLKTVRVLPGVGCKDVSRGFPDLLSTCLYPEWPMAVLPHVSDELARTVAGALYAMPPDSPAAREAHIEGWTIPLNYESVHKLLRDLRIEPYAQHGMISFGEVARQHWVAILFLGLFVLSLIIGAVILVWYSSKIRNAYAQLYKSEATARAILDAPRDAAFLLLDMDGLILTANTVAENRLRTRYPDGLKGVSMWDIGSKAVADYRRQLFDESARSGEPVRFGDERDGMILDNTMYPVRDKNDNTYQMVSVSRDVTAERRAQDKVLTLSRAMDQNPAMIVITDTKGIIEYVNPRFTEVYGYSSEEVLGGNLSILKSDQHDAKFYEAFWKTLQSGDEWTGEICNRSKDGRDIWERMAVSPVSAADGQITHYVAVKEDTTKEHKARQTLIESEERMRAISEASQDSIIMIDDKGLVRFWNTSSESIFGYTSEEVLGKSLHPLVVAEEELEKAEQGFYEFSSTGTGSVVGSVLETTGRRKDGSTFPAEISVASFQYQGRWCAVGTVRDITQRKRDEHRLQELATLDELTGLMNRRRFFELGQAEVKRGRRTGNVFSCIMFDVDHFKRVNDTYGHDVGDTVLKSLAQTATGTLRDIDIVGRLGGEEFIVLLPETPLEPALLAAERLREALASMETVHDNTSLPITVSLGVAQLRENESLEEVIKRADEALYAAKESGRNRVIASR